MSRSGIDDNTAATLVGLAMVLALAFGLLSLMAWLLQFVYGWLAASHGWAPMPFWVAFAVVFLIWELKPRGSSKS